MWPWTRSTAPPPENGSTPEIEERAYTDVITEALVNAAADATISSYVTALEIAAGQLQRAFASANVAGPGADAFPPDVLGQAARSLVELGEAVYYRQGNRLIRSPNYSRIGDDFILNTPAGDIMVGIERIFMPQWNQDAASLKGVSPLATARNLNSIVKKLESAFNQESGAVVGYLLPIPSDGQGRNIEKLKDDLAQLKGNIAVIETARAAWGEGQAAAPRRDFELSRMGPDFPDANVEMYTRASELVLAACGYPVQLVQKSDGTAQREAWRRYLHGTISPIGKLFEYESKRIGLPVSISFDSLFASDIQGRARAFQSLVKGGMTIERAAAASGLLEEE